MCRGPTDRSEAGFSVVEALVALAVFALAGVGLVQLQMQSVNTLSRVETRALADIAAQNALTEALASSQTPDIGARDGAVELGGRTWRWRRVVAATPDAATRRVSVVVFGAGEAPAAQAHGFVAESEP